MAATGIGSQKIAVRSLPIPGSQASMPYAQDAPTSGLAAGCPIRLRHRGVARIPCGLRPGRVLEVPDRPAFAVGRTQWRSGRFRLDFALRVSRPLGRAPWQVWASFAVAVGPERSGPRLSAAGVKDRSGLVGESVRLDPAPSPWTARVATCIATPSAVEVMNEGRSVGASVKPIPQLAPFTKRDLGVDERAPRRGSRRIETDSSLPTSERRSHSADTPACNRFGCPEPSRRLIDCPSTFGYPKVNA
jgi:hypothetical protein